MARIRSVKPAFFRHRRLFKAEQESGLPLRVAFAGLWTCADREGRFKWEPDELKLDCLPYDTLDFLRVLDALLTGGFIVRYACGTREYGFIPSWKEHQIINNRELASVLPPPEIDASTTRDARDTDLSEGKGREGSMEGKGVGALARAPAASPIPEDWKPSSATSTKAKVLGLTDADLRKMLTRFVPLYRSKDERCVDWDARFETWFADEATKLGRKPPSPAFAAAASKVHIKSDTPEWRAWTKHLGKSPPLDNNFGWYFDTRWPPGHKEKAA